MLWPWYTPDIDRKKNRSMAWKVIKSSDPTSWYGPAPRFPHPTKVAKWLDSPSPIRKPSWYDDEPLDRAMQSAKDDPTGTRRTAKKAHEGLMYITPKQYEDDVNAFLYYGMIGLLDPKNPGDALVYSKSFGISYGAALGVAIIGGFFFWGTLGWFFDPKDKREEVGGWRSEWYDKWMNPDNYSMPEGF